MRRPRPRGALPDAEQGNSGVKDEGDDDTFLHAVAARLAPLAESTLVVDNVFVPDLEPELWGGDEQTAALRRAGERLDALDLLPAPFPIEKILPPATCATSCGSTRWAGSPTATCSAPQGRRSASG